MPKVRFEPSGLTVNSSSEAETLAEIAERTGISLEMVCGGRGKCGRCKVIIKENPPPIGEEDMVHISEEDLGRGMRLACLVTVSEDMVVEVPAESIRGDQVILEDSAISIVMEPVVRTVRLRVPPASLDHPVADLERFNLALRKNGISAKLPSPHVLNSLSAGLRSGQEILAVVRQGEILEVLQEGNEGANGLAVDIGTTTVVAYLMDLETGECLAVKSMMNPQIKYGDDVLSRMTYVMRNEGGAETLQNIISSAIDKLAGECCREAGKSRQSIYEMVIVGNTAMHHLFFGLDTYGLGRAPYVPVVAKPFEAKAGRLGVNLAQESYAYSLPNVAGFVGADHMSVLLASRIWESDEPRMVIDIGTNGEISIGSSDGVASTSCAAGPALEGGNIKHGMRGSSGAIDHIVIGGDLGVAVSTINGAKAKGICGSAVVDAIAEMFRAGIINERGKIERELDHPRIRNIDGALQFVLAPENESANGEVISITQKDIGEILSAKAAMYVGAVALMEEIGITQDDLDSILLAGAFGNYISPRSALFMGMLPEVPLERIIPIGNAAGSGAKIALLNRESRIEAQRLAKNIKYIELAARSNFQEQFFEALFIPHFRDELFPGVTSQLRR